MYDETRHRYGRKDESAISRIMSAAGNAKLAKEKAKQEILKQAILSKIRSNQGMNDFKAKEEYKQKQKANDPAQIFMRNRATQENPLENMKLPENEGDAVEFPADKVSQKPDGKMTTKPMNRQEQNQMFLAKVEKTKAAGGKVSPYAEKIAEKMRSQMPKAAGYKRPAGEAKSDTNAATQKVLEKLGKLALEKQLTIDDVIEDLDANEEAYKLQGVDTTYIKKKAGDILPDTYQKGKKGFFGIGSKPDRKKKGGVWYVKKDNYWEPEETKEDDES